jgi:hypothetical protein
MTDKWFNLKGGLRNRGDSGGTRVAARVRFKGEIGMGMHGGGAPKLI